MRNFLLSGTLLMLSLFAGSIHAQDLSNKGRDFWVGYGYHERMTSGGGGSQTMVLYFATEAATNVTVTIPGTGYSQSYSIPANTSFTTSPLPKAGAQDARLATEGISNKGIHIVSDKPIVAYAHIYNQSVSGATLLFPTSTLGKDYYSINYEQLSNSPNANCWFYAIAVDPGTTTIEITPSAKTLSHDAGVPFTVNLTQGQVINIMGELTRQDGDTYLGVDLTGSRIRSISSGTEGCKRIAVFSGSGRISLLCNGVGDGQKSSDNYMVQAFPKNVWGKNYFTVPTQILDNNIFRIAVDDPTTVVQIDGTILTGLINNFYYQVGPLNRPTHIESDKPIMVAQYISTGRFCGNARSGDLGDPEVIYLSPIEQTINRVILNSTPNYAITNHYINVTIPNRGSGLYSFLLDGNVPTAAFTVHPQNSNYSYIRMQVSPGQHMLESDSGFNAIAYGYGDFESYGYNAGANVKDLYQFVTVNNELSTATNAVACRNAPFTLAMTFPYQPTSITWHFNGLFGDVTINNPVADQVSEVNGRTLYRYNLPGSRTANSGIYPITVEALNPTADGCNGIQEINYDLQVFDPPVADFNFTSNGCVSSPVSFADNSTNVSNRPIAYRYWNFGDGSTSTDVATVDHAYAGPGNFNVKYTIITDVGCKSDTARKLVVLNDPPAALFSTVAPYCATRSITFRDGSTTASGNAIVKWSWDFGDSSPPVQTTTSGDQVHAFTNPGTYDVSLVLETVSGCKSTNPPLSITISPEPVTAYTVPEICVNDTGVPFTDASTVVGGTIASWQWAFGDPQSTAANPNVSTIRAGSHHYSLPGNYTTQLITTTNMGCKDTLQQPITVNGGVITARIAVQNANSLCSNKEIIIKDDSQVDAGSITRVEIIWDANDNLTRVIDNDPVRGKNYSHRYPEFAAPASKTYRLRYEAYTGFTCVNVVEQDIVVLATPSLATEASLPLCSNDPAIQMSVQVGNGMTGSGSFSGAGVSATGLFNPLIAGAGEHSIVYTFNASNGCSSSIVRSMLVNPTPNTDAGPDKVVLEGGRVTLTPTLISNFPVSYSWSPGTYLDDPSKSSPVVTPTGDMNYTLTITSDRGCHAADDVSVKLLLNPIIPNIFSPNGDGIHDRWVIDYLESYPGCVVQIFNRYGQRIHQIINYTTPWDGRINGKDAPVGTYYYIIDPKNGRKPMTGYVDIIR